MNHYTKIFFLVCCSFLLNGVLSAQAFYTEDFSNQVNSEVIWISGGTNAGSSEWFWSDNPNILTFGAEPPFDSDTATNGFFAFDSDSNGNNAHDVTLTGPPINCSTQSTVIASFQNQYSYYSQGGVSIASLGVSTDGTNFNYYPILENVAYNDLTDAVQNVVVDISADAAGESTVFLQFRWQGFYEYAWKIDDLELSTVDPTPANDLVISTERFAPNYLQPLSQIDTIRFQLSVDNIGSMNQTNVDAVAEVLLNGNSVYSTSTTLGTILTGAADTMIQLPGYFMPEEEGIYTLKYTITQDATDISPSDNTVSREFQVSEGVFAKDDGIPNVIGSVQPPEIEDDWEVGNNYYVLNDGYKATNVTFSVASDDDVHQTQQVTVKLYEVTPDSDPSDFTDDDVTIVGVAEHTFVNEESFDLITVPLESLATGQLGVILNANTDYIVMINYGEDMRVPYSPLEYPFQVASIVSSDRWYLSGFGPDYTVIARLAIQPIDVAIQDVELSEDNTLEIYPNPVSELLTLDIDLVEQVPQATLRVVDATGKLVYREVMENVKTEKVEINVAQYPEGAYMLHFSTEEGVKTKRFVVGK